MDLGKAGSTEAFTRVALPDSPALPFLFAVSDLPEVMEPVEGTVPVPSVVNGRLEKDGEIDRYRLKVEPGEKLLIELQARELGTSRLEGIITAYDAAARSWIRRAISRCPKTSSRSRAPAGPAAIRS